ncbi:hypothetical protein F3Y22_tig00109978pilonHSYRG00014 [Hibiscus syriacus]|uniref:Uncharacterized protein n=1 Tax=Hibiscus syriacus TaxID=106335 RepID=A0A6A3BQ05_HIBSY|nr:hypothetical protein F3Y22_tig00109978pilonHSYRG00014 [Hibiscus syriacus]
MDSQYEVSSSPSNLNSRKRLFSHTSSGEVEHHQELLVLDLSLGPPCSPSPIHNPNPMEVPADPIPYQHRSRRNPIWKLKQGKSETIGAPFPWATTRRATVHHLNHLLSQNIHTISGEVECKGCQERHTTEYNHGFQNQTEKQIIQLPQPPPPLSHDPVVLPIVPIPQPSPLPIYSDREAHTTLNPNNNVVSREVSRQAGRYEEKIDKLAVLAVGEDAGVLQAFALEVFLQAYL